MATINELICPVCGKSLTSDEYKLAVEEIRTRLDEEYQEIIKKEMTESEEQFQNERKLLQEKIDNLQEKIDDINKNHDEHLKVLRDQLTESYNQQIKDLKKIYDDLDLERQKNAKETLEDKMATYKQQISQSETKYAELQHELEEVKENAQNDAQAAVKNELHSKDIEIRQRDEQILNCNKTIDELKRQLSTTQPERKGEAGEQDLLEDLRKKFPEDQFTRQIRGNQQGDIIQRIRTSSGALLKVPIVYDNKEVARVSKKEIEKQQYYKEHEQTDYLLVVAPSLQKSIKNGVLGRKEGIVLVRRDVVIEVAEYLRGAIIEISRNSESKKSQETKQARIYDYITSREFGRKLESLEKDDKEMMNLQTKEVKDHQILWKNRDDIMKRLRSTYTAISSEIDSIIQGRLPVELDDGSEEYVDDDTSGNQGDEKK
jgi:hypothetical protein